MKKLSLALCVAMLLTMVFGVFASAVEVEEGKGVFYLETFGPTCENGNVNYLGTETDEMPDDIFGVALQVKTGDAPFCYYKIEIAFDPTVIEYVGYSNAEDGDVLAMNTPIAKLIGIAMTNENNVATGSIICNRVNALNFTQKQGFKTVDVYEATCVYFYFRPVSDAPANTTIAFTHTEIRNQIPSLFDSTGINYNLTINGGVEEKTEPLESLGAQVNTESKAIRFGANYYKLSDKGAVEDLGMLVVSDYRLGSDELSMDLANSYVVKVHAFSVLNYRDGLKIDDYDTITYVAAIYGIPEAHLDDDIVARPYVKYDGDDTYYYSDAMKRNYNGVLAAADGAF